MDTYKYERGGFLFTFHVFVCVLFPPFFTYGQHSADGSAGELHAECSAVHYRVVLCCSTLQCVAGVSPCSVVLCCSVLQCVAVCCSVLQLYRPVVLYCVAVCCSVLQYVAECCRCIDL